MSKNFLFAKLFSLNIVAHLFIIQIITLSVFYLPTLLLTYLQRNINTYNYSLTITDSHSSTCTLVMLILFGLVLLKLKLQGVLKKRKNAARIILHADRFDHWRPILKETKAFNVYQINKFKLWNLCTKQNVE